MRPRLTAEGERLMRPRLTAEGERLMRPRPTAEGERLMCPRPTAEGERLMRPRLTAVLTASLTAVLLLTLLTLTACAPLEDAVSFVSELQSPATSGVEAETEPEETSVSPDSAEVRKAMGIVVSGHFSFTEETVSNWMIDRFPGGDWTVSGDAVDYWVSTGGGEAHFGFTVDRGAESFALDICEIDGRSYTEEELGEAYPDS